MGSPSRNVSTTLPVCPKTGSTSPSLTVHLCLHTVPGNRECAPPPDVPVRSLQDILTALQRHPEWRTALRQQLLGEELLELPALFAKFAAETTRRLDLLTQDLAATNKRLDVLAQELAAFKATTTRRLDRLGVCAAEKQMRQL